MSFTKLLRELRDPGQRFKADAIQAVTQAARFCESDTPQFKKDEDIIQAAWAMFMVRDIAKDSHDSTVQEQLWILNRTITQRFRRALADTRGTSIADTFSQHQLSRLEKESLLILMLQSLGLWKYVHNVQDVQDAISINSKERLTIAKLLFPGGRLEAKRLIIHYGGEIPSDMRVDASPEIIAPLLANGRRDASTWNVKTYTQLLDRCCGIIQELSARSIHLSLGQGYGNDKDELERHNRDIDRQYKMLRHTMDKHSDWPLNTIMDLRREDIQIILLLMGQELGYLRLGDTVFAGEGLAKAISTNITQTRHRIIRLRRDMPLRHDDYIQVRFGHSDSPAVEDDATIRTCDFELTDGLLEKLKIKRKRLSKQKARSPLTTFDQLVLPNEVRTAIGMAMAQARNGNVLSEQWGFSETMPYGIGVTLLFSGPPGVGKTACAEAMAHELGKDIIVANYSEIQNCWVGQTEKNIVRLFSEAADSDAVLFWDEADAMFFKRNSSLRSFEIRDVNVLLQEVERFKGICILATNRKTSLDSALDRRITLKVEFPRPDRAIRRRIWQKLVPKNLPLAPDVRLDDYSNIALSGGDIKNIVLNAARLALARNDEGPVMKSDFDEAIRLEQEGGWSEGSRKAIGF